MRGRANPGSPSGSGAAPSTDPYSQLQNRILAYASAIGTEFDFAMLAAAMGLEEEPLAEQLEQLTRTGVLRERAGGERFAFAEGEFRARIYRSLTESRLRVLHRKIAEVLERSHQPPSAEEVAELGRHYFLGKVPEKSYAYNRHAADLARAADEPGVAIHHLERALVDLSALGFGHQKDLAEVAEALGDLRFATSEFDAADQHYRVALENLEGSDGGTRGRLLLARAEIARENLDAESAANGASEAIPLLEAAGDRTGVAQAYRLLGRLAFQRGAYREALDETMRALETLPPNSDERVLGRLSIDLGNAFALLGPEVRADAIEWYQRAVTRLRTARDWPELARALHNLGVAVGETQPEDGLEYLEQARDAAEKAHDTRYAGRALLSGVEMRLGLGQLDEAERDNEQAGRLLDRLADALGTEQVALNRGLIAERRGQWDDAERAYGTAVEMTRRYRLTADEAEAQFHLARLRFKTRDLDGARRAFRTATELNVAELSPRHASAYRELKRQLDEEASGTPEAPGRPAETGAKHKDP